MNVLTREVLSELDRSVFDLEHSEAVRLVHLEYFCSRMVDARGPVLIDRLVDMYVHYGKKHDLQTPEGRNRKALEVRFDLYMHPMPTTLTEICGSFLVSEHLKQSSSCLNSAFNVAVGRSVLDQRFRKFCFNTSGTVGS